MLDKPKYLTGEVETFENYISSFLVALQTEYLKGGENLIKFSNIPEKADDWYFYDQPFETAMIEKYFKYMQDITSGGSIGNPHIIYKNGNHHLWFTPYRVVIERDNPSETHKTMLPRTLNHFISDCIRAGIKLEWRE